jgi:hypothetical protein
MAGRARRCRYYIPAGRLYDAEADPRSRADVIADNRNLANPVIRERPAVKAALVHLADHQT